MNINPGKTEFSEADHEIVRAEVKRLVGGGIAQAEVARQAEVAQATLSQYLSGTYTSEPGRTQAAVRLHKWLRARDAAAAMRRQLPVAPPYMPLRASTSIAAILAYARETGRLVMVTGVPGVSKTATAR